MPIRPLDNRVLVRPIWDMESKTLWTPSGELTTFAFGHVGQKRVATKGDVVAVGPGKAGKRGRRKPPTVKPGDRVHFSDSCSRPVRVDGCEYYFIRDDDVVFVEDSEHEQFAG